LCPAALLTTPVAKDGAEKVRKIAVLEPAATKFLASAATALPAGWWLEATLTAVLANVIVFGTLLRIAECFIRFGGFLEFILGARLFADVRVILARKLAIGLSSAVGSTPRIL
jgi:hypothetical protein